jgi:hypothetical protein
MDDLTKVRPGDDLVIPAGAYNAFIDAARYTQRANAIGAGPSAADLDPRTLVRVRNDTGGDVPRFGVLGIAGPIFEPSADEEAWQQQSSFKGRIALPADAGRFLIAVEPIAEDAIGVACLSGLTIARVDGSESATYADVMPGEVEFLAESESGGAQVLWIEQGSLIVPGPRWALVRLGAPPAASAFYARILFAFAVSGQPNRWTYSWEEVSQAGSGYTGWAAVVDGRSGIFADETAGRNFAEIGNSSSGIQGHGIDVTRAGFPSGFATVPAPVGLVVRMYTVRNDDGETEHWFNFGGNVDGTC